MVKKPQNPRSSHPFDTHTHSQWRLFSCFVSHISSASVSTTACARQMPRFLTKVAEYAASIFYNPSFFSLLILCISSAPSICTFQCLHFDLVSIIATRSGCPTISVSSTVQKCIQRLLQVSELIRALSSAKLA